MAEETPDPPVAAQPESVPPGGARPTNAGRLWITVGVATVLLILLIIFIAQNSQSVKISFLGIHGHIEVGLAMLIAAVVGAVVALLAGTTRIVQLRREVRHHRLARERERERLEQQAPAKDPPA